MTTADKRQPTFADSDLMPFGKHAGEPLQDVPARYLAWLWRDGLSDFSGKPTDMGNVRHFDKTRLANYVWNSKSAIELEIKETL